MPTKSRLSVSCHVSGSRRSSIFVPWVPYEGDGPLSVESSVYSNHARLKGRWSGGGAWFLNRDIYDQAIGNRVPSLTVAEGSTTFLQSVAQGVTQFDAFTAPSEAQLNAFSTTAIAATEPTNPAFDLSVTLGELRMEGLPQPTGFKTWEAQTLRAKNAGSEYLNVEFGWLPLVRSIRDFSSAVDRSDRIVNAYQRDANKVIKRSFQWPDESKSRMLHPINFNAYPTGIVTGSMFQTSVRKKWFETDYIYYLPTGGSIGAKFQRYGSYARKVLGIRLTPEVLWNLSPWSWAADWFGNVGEVLHNVSAIGTDGLVMRNAYIMCHTRTVSEWWTPDSGFSSSMRRTRIQESKIRIPGSPYGFGVTYSSLSSKQVAILAALGLSKW